MNAAPKYGRVAATECATTLITRRAIHNVSARTLFMREHKTSFHVLAIMQNACFRPDTRRERFVLSRTNTVVQRLSVEACMTKNPVKVRPLAHLKIGIKNLTHLTGRVAPERT